MNIKEKINKRDSNGWAHGLWRYWHTDTFKKKKLGIKSEVNYVHGSAKGCFRNWNEKGLLQYECNYEEGRIDGEMIIYEYKNKTT
jgi:antitoxin component YwqK of YwqJK toxin-antitoxin module